MSLQSTFRSQGARLGTHYAIFVSGFASLVVADGYEFFVMAVMLGIGAVAGAIGAGIAATRFLDV